MYFTVPRRFNKNLDVLLFCKDILNEDDGMLIDATVCDIDSILYWQGYTKWGKIIEPTICIKAVTKNLASSECSLKVEHLRISINERNNDNANMANMIHPKHYFTKLNCKHLTLKHSFSCGDPYEKKLYDKIPPKRKLLKHCMDIFIKYPSIETLRCEYYNEDGKSYEDNVEFEYFGIEGIINEYLRYWANSYFYEKLEIIKMLNATKVCVVCYHNFSEYKLYEWKCKCMAFVCEECNDEMQSKKCIYEMQSKKCIYNCGTK